MDGLELADALGERMFLRRQRRRGKRRRRIERHDDRDDDDEHDFVDDEHGCHVGFDVVLRRNVDAHGHERYG
jgi:hypothetical protein